MVTSPSASPFHRIAGALCLDFVNTVDRMVGKPWIDRLRDYGDLCAWSELAGTLSGARAGRLARAARSRADEAGDVLARARALREASYRVFSAVARERSPARTDLDAINIELARAMARARIEPDSGAFAWGWDPDLGALDAPLWPIARSAAELLVSHDRELVKECASDTCLWLFVDRTKNHRRRWCEMSVCGNRAKVRDHRRRRLERATARGAALPARIKR